MSEQGDLYYGEVEGVSRRGSSKGATKTQSDGAGDEKKGFLLPP